MITSPVVGLAADFTPQSLRGTAVASISPAMPADENFIRMPEIDGASHRYCQVGRILSLSRKGTISGSMPSQSLRMDCLESRLICPLREKTVLEALPACGCSRP